MGLLSLVGRIRDRGRRLDDIKPVAQEVRQILLDGNREMILAGKNYDGTTAAPLRPSTLARRKGNGPPRAPRGAESRVITMCEVTVTPAPGRSRFLKSWPGFKPAEYLSEGTRRMAARPMLGYRRSDLDAALAALARYERGD